MSEVEKVKSLDDILAEIELLGMETSGNRILRLDCMTDLARRARAALSALGGWQSIETAPNEPVILYSPPENLSDDPAQRPDIRVARPADFCWATHWRPRPTPPAKGE